MKEVTYMQYFDISYCPILNAKNGHVRFKKFCLPCVRKLIRSKSIHLQMM